MPFRLGFAGTPAFAASHLLALVRAGSDLQLVITQPDRPGKRGQKLLPSPVKLLAEAEGLRLLQPERIGHCTDALRGNRLDLLIVVAYGQLLPEAILHAPSRGCINLHASLLPRWRGAAPVQRAIEAGDTRTGITVMQMDKGLDTGPILLQDEMPILAGETAGDLLGRMAETGPPLLLQALQGLEEGRLAPVEQPSRGVSHAPKLTKSEARLNWNLPAVQLARRVRAFLPDPVASCCLTENGRQLRVKIWQAEAQETATEAPPGTILAADRQGITLACGKDALCLQKLQLPLGKGTVLTAADVMNARPHLFRPGQRLMSE